jgi:hypothetical protein
MSVSEVFIGHTWDFKTSSCTRCGLTKIQIEERPWYRFIFIAHCPGEAPVEDVGVPTRAEEQ